MTMNYTVRLTCGGCKAVLTFTDERPDWQTYDYRVEQTDECERSGRFVTEHTDDPLPAHIWESSPDLNEAYVAAGRPRFIDFYDWEADPTGATRRLSLAIPKAYRYVDCPVCDGQVKEPGGG